MAGEKWFKEYPNDAGKCLLEHEAWLEETTHMPSCRFTWTGDPWARGFMEIARKTQEGK